MRRSDKQQKVDTGISCPGIFATFFRVGLFTLGGGLAMATVVRHELVLKRKWIRDEDFMNELSTATLVPGAIAVNLAYMQGRRLKGLPGAFSAVSGTILPSFLIILLIAFFAMPYFNHPGVAAFFKGCAIAVGGQIAFAGYVFARKRLQKAANILVCLLGILAVAVLKLHPVLAVFITGAVGYFVFAKKFPNDNDEQIDSVSHNKQNKGSQ